MAPALLSILWPVLLACGGYIAWQQWGEFHVATQFQAIEQDSIHITAQPEYIPQDIVKTVYVQTALDRVSLLDATATAKIASAFSSNPWIHEVTSVRKLPGGVIDVHLRFRRPAAMAYVAWHPKLNGPGYYPLDGEGVVLPPSDFSRAQAELYVKIDIPDANFNGNSGDSFGDQRVIAAARLAAALFDYQEQTKISSITVYGDRRQQGVPQLELTTIEGVRIPWGSPPGQEQPGEPTAMMKLQTLVNGVSAGSDLRNAGRPLSSPY